MMNEVNEHALTIRSMSADDASTISEAFAQIGWTKPVEQYVRYAKEQDEGARDCWIALVDGQFAGYVTVVWSPDYPAIAGRGIPEIQDLNVLPEFGRRGVASRLLDRAESVARGRANEVAIGVGLHPGYNAAQRVYVKRGYIPDARGVTYKDQYVREGEQVSLDDDLVIHFTKVFGPDGTG